LNFGVEACKISELHDVTNMDVLQIVGVEGEGLQKYDLILLIN